VSEASRGVGPGRGATFVPDPSQTLFYRVVRRLVWIVITVWFRPSIAGPGTIPTEGPALIAPVHRSNLDFAFAILATDRKLFFMAKDSLWESALLGRLLVVLGAFPVHRESADRSALARAEAVLSAGQVLVLFPEGTRREGPEVTGVLEGAGFLSARSGAPVLPVGIGGSDRALPKGSWVPRPRKVRLFFGETIAPPERGEHGRVPRSAIHRQSEAIKQGIQAAYDAARTAVA
jgi:1-acyl-sn-glycerol-3-phosphate acyltransferase